jgi:hypothetical protein
VIVQLINSECGQSTYNRLINKQFLSTNNNVQDWHCFYDAARNNKRRKHRACISANESKKKKAISRCGSRVIFIGSAQNWFTDFSVLLCTNRIVIMKR